MQDMRINGHRAHGDLVRVCAEPGCPTLTDQTRCTQHHKAKRKAEDKRRPNAQARGYDKHWQRTRTAYLTAYPICQWPEGCLTPATDVHHRDGQGPNGPAGHDWANLQGLCHSHHSKVTATMQPGGFR
jgi:5-methylcytosine-specific restriction enzyme A